MPFFTNPNQMAWDTVEIPLVAGVDLRSPERTVQAPALLAADNLRYDSGASLRKRLGHVGYRVRTLARVDLDMAGTNGQVASYLFGRGVVGESADTINSSPGPDAGYLRGMAKRDNEVLAWDGWRLFSWPAEADVGAGWQSEIGAVMPTAVTTPIAKAAAAQIEADAGEADKLRVVAWIAGGDVKVSVYDPVTGSPYLTDTALWGLAITTAGAAAYGVAPADAEAVRVVPCGEWVHVVTAYADTTYDVISFHHNRPNQPVQTTLGDCDLYFDCRKVSEAHWLLLVLDSAQDLKLSRFNADGSATSLQSKDITGLIAGYPGAAQCAVAQHPLTGEIAIAFVDDTDDTKVWSTVLSPGADTAGTPSETAVGSFPVDYVSVEAQYILSGDYGKFSFYLSGIDQTIPGTDIPTVKRYDIYHEVGALSAAASRKYAMLQAHAFRIGQAVHVLLGRRTASGNSTLQYARYLCDADLKPVGRLEYATSPTRGSYLLPSIHFSKGQEARNRSKFHGILVYRVRVDSLNNDQYDEESLKWLDLDYLPKLRSAQLGRCTYFAGAQVHAYDGQAVTEAGFHEYPEDVVPTDSTTAGSPDGTYTYKVRWAWKNAQGEEVISASVFSAEVTVVTNKVTVTIPTLGFTRKSGVYALIYRNENAGVVWYLVSSRDLSDVTGDNCAVMNDPTANTVTFTDNLSDTAILSLEQDTIGNAGGLERFSPPGCQAIAAGRDRLWLAGGEIPSGSILPSLLFEGGKAVHFDQRLQTVVDREVSPVTAFGFLGNSTLVFKTDRIYAFEADGPSNLGTGSFDLPRIISTDAGTRGQEGMVLVESGIFFQGPSTIQMLGFNYQVSDPGGAIPDSGVMTIAGAYLDPKAHEVRFYSATAEYPTLVFNLDYKQWTTWTGLECAGAVPGPDYKACLGRLNGRLWVETEGVWTDAGRGIRARWRTAWLRAEHLQSFQRVRHVATVGDYRGAHTLRLRAFYDDRDYPEATAYWDPDDDLNTATWGDEDWGAGVWGDTARTEAYAAPRDRVFRQRRGLARQKCSTVSFEIDDGAAHTEGPALTALAVEFGRRNGLGRVPARSFS